MRLSVIVFLILLISHTLPAQDKSSAIKLDGFRNVAWGASVDEVKAAEKAEYMQHFSGFGIEAVSYKGCFAGFDVRIDYSFKNNKLVEGCYSLSPDDSFKPDYITLRNYLSERYGKPEISAGPPITSDSVWIKESNYGRFSGPETYWHFANGFIGLHASRFKERIRITVLFVSGMTIEQYNKNNAVSY